MTPGIAAGVTDEPLKQPALPNEAPSPGLPGSIRKTLLPSRCSQLAAHTPTMPAPITPTRRAALAAIIRLPAIVRPTRPRPEWRPGEAPATGDARARRMAAGGYPIGNRSAVRPRA